MQYETILLELMSRIKTLEQGQAVLHERVDTLMQQINENFSFEESAATENSFSGQKEYIKMNEEMIELCYAAGKKLYSDANANIGALADETARKSGMNRNSAFMYIYVVDCMLRGVVYKRAISTKATEKYFKAIDAEYGKVGLQNALRAAREHIQYRKSLGHAVDGLAGLCAQYETFLI